eukprot:scaffold11.g4007.t1
MPTVTVAATCFHCSGDLDANLEQFACYYFPAEENPEHFRLVCLKATWAHPLDGHPFLPRFQKLAAELDIVLPLSYFECCNQAFYNSLAIADADGQWTKFGKIGAMVCWDQWFPEAARACVLQGAEILTYPSAIGSEPSQPDHNSYPHWRAARHRRSLQRRGGGSFIAGPEGEVVAQVGGRKEHLSAGHFDPHPEKEEGIVTATFDLDVLQQQRNAGAAALTPMLACFTLLHSWALFRDRRPDKYGVLCTQDGKTRVG